jgi:hypothetical protein
MRIKNWKWNCALAVPLLVTITTSALAADGERFSIYGWRDDAGIRHYTNELADVPDADRHRVATLIKDWVAPEPPAQDTVCSTPDTAQTTQAAAAPVSVIPEATQSSITYNVDASQSSSVVQDDSLAAQQPVLFDDFIPVGGRPSLERGARPTPDSFRAAGPSPRNAVGPTPWGAAGPPALGAPGHPPIGVARGRR